MVFVFEKCAVESSTKDCSSWVWEKETLEKVHTVHLFKKKNFKIGSFS
jgi:hypothetical protein